MCSSRPLPRRRTSGNGPLSFRKKGPGGESYRGLVVIWLPEHGPCMLRPLGGRDWIGLEEVRERHPVVHGSQSERTLLLLGLLAAEEHGTGDDRGNANTPYDDRR